MKEQEKIFFLLFFFACWVTFGAANAIYHKKHNGAEHTVGRCSLYFFREILCCEIFFVSLQ